MQHIAPHRERIANKQNVADAFIVIGLAAAVIILINMWTYDNEYNELVEHFQRYQHDRVSIERLPHRFGNAIRSGDDRRTSVDSREAVQRFRRGLKVAKSLEQSSWHGNLITLKRELVSANRNALDEALAYQRTARMANSGEAIGRELHHTENWQAANQRAQNRLAYKLRAAAPWKPRITLPGLGTIGGR